MLVANDELREKHAFLYNDTFLGFFCVTSMWMLSKNRPLLSAIFLSLAISLKAGAVLLIPSVFGLVFYYNGSLTLIYVIVIIMFI
jgi:predicted membrane-bound dolichyl-phosphate-mannose-protein mannosyltransferase